MGLTIRASVAIYGISIRRYRAYQKMLYHPGYDDEYYFSRFFKKNTDISPQLFRETVGHGRG
jgi:hypothetical protein